MNGLLILGFTISSSLDNLGVGISYGIRKIHIGYLSNLVIAVICFLFSFSGIWFGKWLAIMIPGVLAERLGACILMVIGIRIIWLAFPPKQQNAFVTDSKAKSIGTILQNPECADLDHSNDIGIMESLILGVALSLNALTNGLSAGLFGLSPMILSLATAAASFLTIGFGEWLGSKAANIYIGSFSLGQFGTLISGMILLFIAVNNFF